MRYLKPYLKGGHGATLQITSLICFIFIPTFTPFMKKLKSSKNDLDDLVAVPPPSTRFLVNHQLNKETKNLPISNRRCSKIQQPEFEVTTNLLNNYLV